MLDKTLYVHNNVERSLTFVFLAIMEDVQKKCNSGKRGRLFDPHRQHRLPSGQLGIYTKIKYLRL